MSLKRRQFLYSSGAVFISSFAKPFNLLSRSLRDKSLYFSSGADLKNKYFFSALNYTGKEKFRVHLPTRGHGSARRPNTNEVAVFSRSPGRYILVIDISNGEKLTQIKSIEGRHFYGHGVFSPNGQILYVTENEYDSGNGLIGMYDTNDNYRLIDTISAHGIGPHAIEILSDGMTLVVANGGILTHPDTGRVKLNLSELDSSLTYIEVPSGKLLFQKRLDEKLKLMSIRHLAVGPGGNISLAMQYQGPRNHLLPLVGIQQGSGPIQLLTAPEKIAYKMRNYCGSISFNAKGNLIGVSSPRGGIITFWSFPEKRFFSYLEVLDGCGIAAEDNTDNFLITNGLGEFLNYSPERDQADYQFLSKETQWDNHLLLAGNLIN